MIPARPRWHEEASCKGKTELFFEACWIEVEDRQDRKKRTPVKPAIAAAREMCWHCPVRIDCFADAMSTEEGKGYKQRFGVWAGLTPAQRRHVEQTTGWRCKRCGRVFDPKTLMAGKKTCGCGVRLVDPLPDQNERALRQLRKPKEVPSGSTSDEESPSQACA